MRQPERQVIRIPCRIRRPSESLAGQGHLVGDRIRPNRPMTPDVDTNRRLSRDNGYIATRPLELPQTSCRIQLG